MIPHRRMGTIGSIWFDKGMSRPFSSLFSSLLVAMLCAPALLAAVEPGPAAAASAACQPDVKAVPAAVDAADSIVTVKVTRATGPIASGPTSTKPARLAYKARVLSSFKGTGTGTITVLTDKRGGVRDGCAAQRLAVGTTYLLFLTAQGRSWYASLDMPSSHDVAVLQPQVEAALAPPSATFSDPLAGKPTSLRRVAAPGVALVIIGLLGLLVVRRSPRRHV